jgi:hypothetical protein
VSICAIRADTASHHVAFLLVLAVTPQSMPKPYWRPPAGGRDDHGATRSAACECARRVSGRVPEAEEREVIATTGEAGGDSSPIALDIDKFHEVFIG